MPQQLGFDLPFRTALGREDFLVSPANALALAMIDGWASWPQGKMVISGPQGAGKSHLAHVWASMSNARIIPAAALTQQDLTACAQSPIVIEDLPQIADDMAAQEAMFHLHNMLLAGGHALLMTGRQTPNHWGLTLPDLQSRVDAAGHAPLEAPDDALLAAILAKLFADRQLRPRPDVIPYLLARMERSFAAAGATVSALDAQSLADRCDITRSLATRVLDKLT